MKAERAHSSTAARRLIDARRVMLGSIGFWSAVVTALVLAALFSNIGWVVNLGSNTAFRWKYSPPPQGWLVVCTLAGVLIFRGIFRYLDVCPRCKKSIAMLPCEKSGIFESFKLSKSIRMCPYCGEDFTFSPKPPSPPPSRAAESDPESW